MPRCSKLAPSVPFLWQANSSASDLPSASQELTHQLDLSPAGSSRGTCSTRQSYIALSYSITKTQAKRFPQGRFQLEGNIFRYQGTNPGWYEALEQAAPGSLWWKRRGRLVPLLPLISELARLCSHDVTTVKLVKEGHTASLSCFLAPPCYSWGHQWTPYTIYRGSDVGRTAELRTFHLSCLEGIRVRTHHKTRGRLKLFANPLTATDSSSKDLAMPVSMDYMWLKVVFTPRAMLMHLLREGT